MKVSIDWFKELISLNTNLDKLLHLIPLKIPGGIKEVTKDSFTLDIKGYNRADLLSLRGVAYEVAAITCSKVTFTETAEDDYAWAGYNLPQTSVRIENPKLCPLYCIAKVEGLKVGPSVKEWVKKLANCGMRSVNNIADVTNLVMLEYGQPLHAFDAGKIKNQTLIVRTAKAGEKIITLDGKERKLDISDLLIADPQKPLGLAGVMGGLNSEVTGSTSTILLEAAIFKGPTLRKTSQRLGIPSEASKRFQHGLTKKRLLQALSAAIKMYEQLGGRLVALSINGDFEDKINKIKLGQQKVNSLIGVKLEEDQIESDLKKLSFAVKKNKIGEWEVVPPYWRLDIDLEEDLIEEIARMYGYEKIPSKPLTGQVPVKIDQSFFESMETLKNTLADSGLTEVQTYSFYSSDVLRNLELDQDKLIKIANPISSETEYLRDKLWPNLLEAVAKNLKNGEGEVVIFEIGKVYKFEEKRLQETYQLALVLSNDSNAPVQELYQIFKKVAEDNFKLSFEEHLHHTKEFHPVRFWKLKIDDQEAGILTEVHPKIVNRFGIEKRVAVLEIKLDFLK